MNDLTLEQIQEKIEYTRLKIEQFFRTLNNPENIMISKDTFWGQRSINLYIRLDEFSIEQFENHLRAIKQLFDEYKQLRSVEKEKADKAAIEKRIQQDIIGKYF